MLAIVKKASDEHNVTLQNLLVKFSNVFNP